MSNDYAPKIRKALSIIQTAVIDKRALIDVPKTVAEEKQGNDGNAVHQLDNSKSHENHQTQTELFVLGGAVDIDAPS